MNKANIKNIFFFCLCLLSIGLYAQNDTIVNPAAVVFPEPTGYITDTEDIFTEAEEATLTAIIEDFTVTGKGQIAVLTIASIKPYDDFYRYALDLSNHWGVGHKGKDDGVTIVISAALRQIRINTGNGTQKILSDSFCNNVLQNKMIPNFKNMDYYQGVKEGLESLITEWKQ